MKRVRVLTWCIAFASVAMVFPAIAVAQFGGESAKPKPAEAAKTVEPANVPAAESKPEEQRSGELCKCVGEAESASVKKIQQALDGPLHSAGLDYVEQPLQDIVNQLQEEYGIPIQLDVPALDAVGIRPDEKVTLNIHNVSLRAALRLMLKRLQLTYLIENEVLILTTPDEAEKTLKTCVYDVRDLAALYKPRPQARQMGGNDIDFDPLVDAITECIAKETWSENGGGEAQIRPLQPGLLVISQTAAVHEQIRELLAALRALHGNAPTSSQTQTSNAPVVAPAAPGEVVTRSYVLQLGGEPEALRSQVRELVTESLPDEPWSGRLPDGQGVLLAVFPDRIVVRHRPDVQEKVRRLLGDSGIAAPAPSTEDQPGMFGGGGFGRGGGFGGGMRGAMGMSPRQPGSSPADMRLGPEGRALEPEGGRGPVPGQPSADNPFSE